MSDIEISVLLSAKHISTGSWAAFKELALECERLGYKTIWLADHLTRGGFRLESLSTLSALASVTKEIRLGTLTLCNPWRNPALLAKIAATIDVISEGRLEFGIGCGFLKHEFDAYGFPFPRLSVRTAQLGEALEIIKKLWSEDKPSYKGRYYQIQETVCEPKPTQKPHPPITIGGGNEKYTLPLVAKHADRWNLASSVEEYRQKSEALKQHCARIGRDFAEIKKSNLFNITGVYQSEEETEEAWKKIWEREGKRIYTIQSEYLPFEDWLRQVENASLMGTPEDCIARMEEYIEIGVTCFELRFVDLPDRRHVLGQFMEKVAKKVF